MKKKKCGFTLMELLVVTTIGFIIILLVYRTMQTTLKVSQDIRERIADMQRINFFLETFASRLMCALADSKNNSFTSSGISIELNEYNCRKVITYTVEPDENGRYDLNVKEKDILLDTEFSYPAMVDLDRVEFSFFDGESWKTAWDKETFPPGIAIEMEKQNSKLFFPVMINIQSAHET